MFSLRIKLHCQIQCMVLTLQELQRNTARECSAAGSPQLVLRKYDIDYMVAFLYLVRSWTVVSTELDNLKYEQSPQPLSDVLYLCA